MIMRKEKNSEWKAFLEMLWHVGASQGDLAALSAQDIDTEHRLISFSRQKTRSLTVQRYGEDVAAILRRLPAIGPLFPKLAQYTSPNRAARFAKTLKRRGISGVSLHSYRYAWAERARAQMEMGGKNPTFVLVDADVQTVIIATPNLIYEATALAAFAAR